jgi:putative colanic acid biosynthesis glycosyltransferase
MDLSIVTIHLNDFDGLLRTYHSLQKLLARQQVSWVVIDGDSRVKTEDQKKCFDLVRSAAAFFISEPDNGIYDAMNKGTKLATADYVLYLNAGDELHPDFAFENLLQTNEKRPAEMIWGRCLVRYPNDSTIRIKTRSPSWTWYGMPACHSSIFFQREVLGENPYNTHYHIGADYDLVCRLVSNNAQVAQFNSLVSIFYRGGLSDVSGETALVEENEIRLKYFKIPAIAGGAIKQFRGLSSKLAQVSWLRRLWRSWI